MENTKFIEMSLADMFAIKGVGLVVVGNVSGGSIQVGDKMKFTSGDYSIEDTVLSVNYDRSMNDSFSFQGVETQIGLVFGKLKRKDFKGGIDSYSISFAEPIEPSLAPAESECPAEAAVDTENETACEPPCSEKENEASDNEPGLVYIVDDNYYKIVGEEEPCKENSLYLTIKQNFFDEIIAGTKTIEYREIKETTYKKYLECDKQNYPMINDGLMSPDDPLYDDICVWNNGVYPFVPKQRLRYLDLAVGYNKERDTARIELDGFKFAPAEWAKGLTARFSVEDDQAQIDPEGDYCYWIIELHIKKVISYNRH